MGRLVRAFSACWWDKHRNLVLWPLFRQQSPVNQLKLNNKIYLPKHREISRLILLGILGSHSTGLKSRFVQFCPLQMFCQSWFKPLKICLISSFISSCTFSLMSLTVWQLIWNANCIILLTHCFGAAPTESKEEGKDQKSVQLCINPIRSTYGKIEYNERLKKHNTNLLVYISQDS